MPTSHIPSVDKILKHPLLQGLNRHTLKKSIQQALEPLRAPNAIPLSLENIAQKSLELYHAQRQSNLIPLVNATGILLHTNLGRAPLSSELLAEITPALTAYNTLEFDLATGQRGERYKLLKDMMCDMLGCEDMLVVNNNAAALFLIINTFALSKEVIISRGELIEIGGSFRIPSVIERAGAILREIGTTNKTHEYDYTEAITNNTAMLLKVHCSNYRIQGFTQEVPYDTLIQLAKTHQLIDCYDVGSGLLTRDFITTQTLQNELKSLYHEPIIQDLMRLNPSLITFSGDKLLGSVQAGIILGKSNLIHTLKHNQLLRMLRVDKITLALLEASFKAYFEQTWEKIPLVHLLKTTTQELHDKALTLLKKLPKPFCGEVIPSTSYMGGGALPQKELPSIALKLTHPNHDATSLQQLLREHKIIARISQNTLLIETRTLLKDDDTRILEALKAIA